MLDHASEKNNGLYVIPVGLFYVREISPI